MKNKNNKKRRAGKVFMTVGIVLLLASLGLTVYNLWDENRAQKVTATALKIIEETRSENLGNKNGTSENGQNNNPGEKPAYQIAPQMAVPEKEIDGHYYIGTIDIPSLGLSLPVQSEWSLPNLRTSPCRYKGSPYLDDMIIAAHNYSCHFGNIRDLVEGDEVIFTDMDGNVFVYNVAYTETIDGYDIPRMSEGEWDLTLFTCTLSSVSRVTVRCVRQAGSDA